MARTKYSEVNFTELMFDSAMQCISTGFLYNIITYLSTCMWLLHKLVCHIFVISSVLALDGLLATDTNIINVWPFFVACKTFSGFDMSSFVKSRDGGFRRCSGNSSSGKGSSSSSHWSYSLQINLVLSYS